MAAASDRLLLALAEELKTPLLQIAREAEVMRMVHNKNLPVIEQSSRMALKLIDGYMLGLDDQQSLELEPLNISSVLYESAHELSSAAKQLDVELKVSIKNKYGPIMAQREHLQAAFTMLGYQALSQSDQATSSHAITLGAHRSKHGIVAGVYSSSANFSADTFRRAQAFTGTARQTYPNASHSNGAGMMLADALFQSMSVALKVSRHQNQPGLAATFLPSAQLMLV